MILRAAGFIKRIIFMNCFQALRNLQKQPQEGVLEKKCSFSLGYNDVFWMFLVMNSSVNLGSESGRNSIIIFKRHVNPQAYKVIFYTSIKETWTEMYLEPSQTSTMELFCENSWRLKPVNYFPEKGQSYMLNLVLNTPLLNVPVLLKFWLLRFPRSGNLRFSMSLGVF